MPSFQRSVAILPLPIRCSVVPLRARTELLETSVRWRHLKWRERWLAVRLWQNSKNRIRSYLLRNGSYGAPAGGNGNGPTEFFYIGNVILTALTEFLRNLCNGNGMLETRH